MTRVTVKQNNNKCIDLSLEYFQFIEFNSVSKILLQKFLNMPVGSQPIIFLDYPKEN